MNKVILLRLEQCRAVHAASAAVAPMLYGTRLICDWNVGPLRPLNLNVIWALGYTQALEELRTESLRRPGRDFLHVLVTAEHILMFWVGDEHTKRELPKAHARAVELLHHVRHGANFIRADLSEPLGSETLDNIANAYSLFQEALTYELAGLSAYLLEDKRGYSVQTLLNDIEACLPADDRGMLSEFARDNLQEAGASLVFHRFTGCG
jgi:hypothetical protein